MFCEHDSLKILRKTWSRLPISPDNPHSVIRPHHRFRVLQYQYRRRVQLHASLSYYHWDASNIDCYQLCLESQILNTYFMRNFYYYWDPSVSSSKVRPSPQRSKVWRVLTFSLHNHLQFHVHRLNASSFEFRHQRGDKSLEPAWHHAAINREHPR